jgi:hypothetical protein
MSISPLSGASETVTSRSVLAGYQMNFASYGGYQELESRRSETIDRLDFRLNLSDGAIFDVFYSEHNGERSGFRISTTRVIPGRVYRMREYQFSRSEFRPELEITRGWHDISIRQKKDGLWLFIDGRPLMRLPESRLSSAFAFRSGKEKVILAKVECYRDGKLVWEDGFRPGRLWGAAAKKAGLILAGIWFAALLFFRHWRAVESILRYTLAFCLLWLAFDYFYYSHLPTYRNKIKSYLVHPTVPYFNFEDFRLRAFETLFGLPGDGPFELLWLPPYPPEINEIDPLVCVNDRCWIDKENIRFQPKGINEKRLILIGGSMLRAPGVKNPENVFFYNVARLAHHQLGVKNFTAIDLAKSEDVEDQVRLFFDEYKEFRPDIIMASFLGIWNKSQQLAFNKLFEYCRRNGILLIYLTAPMNREFKYKPISGLDWIRKTYGIAGLDLNLAFSDERYNNTGILWWDDAHLTDYGNRKIFEFSRPFIEQSLSALSKRGTAAREEIQTD